MGSINMHRQTATEAGASGTQESHTSYMCRGRKVIREKRCIKTREHDNYAHHHHHHVHVTAIASEENGDSEEAGKDRGRETIRIYTEGATYSCEQLCISPARAHLCWQPDWRWLDCTRALGLLGRSHGSLAFLVVDGGRPDGADEVFHALNVRGRCERCPFPVGVGRRQL